MTKLLTDCDHFIAGAALIGGISYFHAYAYDLLATNERIMASPVRRRHRGAPRRHGCRRSPTCPARWSSSPPPPGRRVEGDERKIPPPLSSYGFQKLAVEYFAQAAWDQYQLPYTDRPPVQLRRHRRAPRPRRRRGRLRQRQARHEPRRARPGAEGRSRARTRCTSSATATRSATTPTAATWPRASSSAWSTRRRLNDDFNISTAESHDRARAGRGDLAQDQGRGRAAPLVSDAAYEYDVQKRVPDVDEGPARCSASRRPRRSTTMLDEVIPWVTEAVEHGRL